MPVIVDGLTGSIFWVSLRVRGFHSPQGLGSPHSPPLRHPPPQAFTKGNKRLVIPFHPGLRDIYKSHVCILNRCTSNAGPYPGLVVQASQKRSTTLRILGPQSHSHISQEQACRDPIQAMPDQASASPSQCRMCFIIGLQYIT